MKWTILSMLLVAAGLAGLALHKGDGGLPDHGHGRCANRPYSGGGVQALCVTTTLSSRRYKQFLRQLRSAREASE